MKSHLFGGVFCSSSSTYDLRRTADEFSSSQLVRDTIYNDFGKAIEVITGVKTALKQGGFNLRSYVVNDYKLLEFIPTSDIADNVKCLTPDIMSKALGTHWNVTNDVFYYIAKHSTSNPDSVVTRRDTLSMVASLYDPLGLVSPITLKRKLIF